MSKNKICIVCGKKYEYCGHCDSNRKQNRWKTNYCSENCRDIFNIVLNYANRHTTIDVAKKELTQKNININIGDNIGKTFGEILSYEEPKSTVVKISHKDIIEDKKEESIILEEDNVIENPQPKRRRGRRRKTEIIEEE